MANTTNFGWETPDDTDLVKDGAAAIRTLAGAIDTSLVDLKGGTTGQVLAKNSNTDMDFVWSADASGIPATIFDAKGDLIVASAADTAARLASSGTNGNILMVDTSTATGLKWAAPAGGGKVLQVVQGTNVNPSINTSSTMTDTGLSASITPSSTSSRIYVAVQFSGTYVRNTGTSTDVGGAYSLVRGTTQLQNTSLGVEAFGSTSGKIMYGNIGFSYLDSPATTSSITYKTQSALYTGTSIITGGATTQIDSIVLMEIGA